MSQSEVARIREQIERECEALRLLSEGFAAVSSHEIIAHHYTRLGTFQLELDGVLGHEQATDVICDIYNQIVK